MGRVSRSRLPWRRTWLRWALAAAIVGGCSRSKPPDKTARESLTRAIAWLVEQQAADGLWHSQTYGQLRSGAALSCLAVYALAHCDADLLAPHEAALAAARRAIARRIEPSGRVTNPDGLDYPTYATALLLVAIERLGWKWPEDQRHAMLAYLRAAQIDEGEKYTEGDVDFGGWDMVGDADIPRRTPGTNVSVTASVCEALQTAPVLPTSQTIERAARWLDRCRLSDGDGGFFFHPQRDHEGNKAGWTERNGTVDRTSPLSYGTATCDGLRIALACGKPALAHSAAQWLSERQHQTGIPGLPLGEVNGWGDGLSYYYRHALAKSLPAIPPLTRGLLSERIRTDLIAAQRVDGSWRNPSARMREDDPLVATCLAIVALAAAEDASDILVDQL